MDNISQEINYLREIINNQQHDLFILKEQVSEQQKIIEKFKLYISRNNWILGDYH